MTMTVNSVQQQKQKEWLEQWTIFTDEEQFLFEDWIAPVTLNDFKDKSVLECGCGGGQHTAMVAPVARSVTAVDLNTIDLAHQHNAHFQNVCFVDADIATMDLGEQFDIVFCIGVIHHTDDPDLTFSNIYKHCSPGGRVIIWTYSAEGNSLVRFILEPIRKAFLQRLSLKALVVVSRIITALLYPIVYGVYTLPVMSFLPYYEYFRNFRRLSFDRNMLNVFDKINAPQTRFTTLKKCHEWFTPDLFESDSISIRRYAGVSYSLSGIKRC